MHLGSRSYGSSDAYQISNELTHVRQPPWLGEPTYLVLISGLRREVMLSLCLGFVPPTPGTGISACPLAPLSPNLLRCRFWLGLRWGLRLLIPNQEPDAIDDAELRPRSKQQYSMQCLQGDRPFPSVAPAGPRGVEPYVGQVVNVKWRSCWASKRSRLVSFFRNQLLRL